MAVGTQWRLAGSLEKLKTQINTAHPNRSKASDGGIGDVAHQAQGSASDHNVNAAGVVCAYDFTHDPSHGLDARQLADSMASSRDGRIKYMIFNDHIMVPSNASGWTWVYHYAGSHRQHLHVSVWNDYDNTKQWKIGDIDVAEKANLDTARIFSDDILGQDGFDGRFNAHAGQTDSGLVGFELTNANIRKLWMDKQATLHRDIRAATYRERDTLRKQVLALRDQLAATEAKLRAAAQVPVIPTTIPTVPSTPAQEPIDTKQVNWLVRILINLFDKKQ